jgi:hypothetical protein
MEMKPRGLPDPSGGPVGVGGGAEMRDRSCANASRTPFHPVARCHDFTTRNILLAESGNADYVGFTTIPE